MGTEKNTVKKRDKTGKFALGNQEGNRNGRPKNELSIPDLLRKIGDMPFNAKHTYLQQMLTIVYGKAAAGVPWAVEFVADRTEGKAKQDIQLTQIKDQIEIE